MSGYKDQSKPEVENDGELQQSCDQKLGKLRVFEFLSELTSDSRETIVSNQKDDREGMKYFKNNQHYASRMVVQEGPFFYLLSNHNLNLISDNQSMETSVGIFSGKGLTGFKPPETPRPKQTKALRKQISEDWYILP